MNGESPLTGDGGVRRLVFVVGQPRSGTKLVRALLNQHSDVAIPRVESQFIPRLVASYERTGRINPMIVRESNFLRDLRDDGVSVPDDVVSGTGCDELPTYLWRLLLEAADASQDDRHVAGDKTPDYVFHLSAIARAMPQALFLHVVRDPRAVAASARAAWGKSLVRSADAWSRGAAAVASFSAEVPGRLVSIRYEDVLAHPLSALEPAWDLVGIPPLREVREFDQPVERIGGARDARDLRPERATAFERSLTRDEVDLVEGLCFESMTSFGYEPRVAAGARSVSVTTLGWHRAADVVRRLLSLIRERGLLGGLTYAWRLMRTHR